MPRYRKLAVTPGPSVRDLRAVKPEAEAEPEPVGEKAEAMTVGDMDVKPVDEVSATAGEQTGEPEPKPLEDVGQPPKRKRGRPRKNPA